MIAVLKIPTDCSLRQGPLLQYLLVYILEIRLKFTEVATGAAL